MVEESIIKKFVVDGMKLSYDGPFDIVEFYKKVEDWISSKGKEKEIKKKVEHVEAKGKKIEWFIEIWEDVAEYAKTVVRMRALFTDVKEIKVKKLSNSKNSEGLGETKFSQKGERRKRLNSGNVLIIFDGILETDISGKWQQKPVFYFLRAVVDMFIHKFYMNKFEDKLAKDVYELNDTLKDFFDSYKV